MKDVVMKKTLVLVALTLSNHAFAKIDIKDIKCSFDAWGVKMSDVKVHLTMGGAPKLVEDIAGHQVAVGFFAGDQFESQQVLTLKLNDGTTKIYDPKAQSLVVVNGAGLSRLQCFAEK